MGSGFSFSFHHDYVCVCGVAGFPIIVGNVYYISHFDWQREKDGGQFNGRQQFGNDEIFFFCSLKERKKTSRRHPGV